MECTRPVPCFETLQMSLMLWYRKFYKKIAIGFRVDVFLDPLLSLQHVMQCAY